MFLNHFHLLVSNAYKNKNIDWFNPQLSILIPNGKAAKLFLLQFSMLHKICVIPSTFAKLISNKKNVIIEHLDYTQINRKKFWQYSLRIYSSITHFQEYHSKNKKSNKKVAIHYYFCDVIYSSLDWYNSSMILFSVTPTNSTSSTTFTFTQFYRNVKSYKRYFRKLKRYHILCEWLSYNNAFD